MTTVAITGHRPERIPNIHMVEHALAYAFHELEVEKVIQGMAAGVDLLAARTAFRMNIPFISARPWAGHTPRVADEYDYMMAINNAIEVVDVDPSTSYPGAWVYQKRNEWMVDNAELVIAVWDGERKGGTFNCVKYANQEERHIYCIDPATGAAEWIWNDEPV